MCCFSATVGWVRGTSVFARAAQDGRQHLAYEMAFSSIDPVAMILPLPVPPGSPEQAVRFHALDQYEHLFLDLMSGFPVDIRREPLPLIPLPGTKSMMLTVQTVGEYEASFVPTVADFRRLDPRFRMPDGVWDALPAYRSFGFAVFQLQPGAGRVHPMAFEFPRRDPSRLFFPTVHVHDGAIHALADFDHALYCQGAPPPGWETSYAEARRFVLGDTCGMVDPAAHVYRRRIVGMHANADVYV